jgi:hypothetical protein
MASATRHTSDKRTPPTRTYPGDPWTSNLVSWLNGDVLDRGRNSRASRSRLLDFMDSVRKVTDAIAAAPSWDLINNPTPRLNRVINELNARLDEYPSTPTFYINWGREWVFDDAIAGRRPPGESVAIHGVIELAKLHLLDRVIRCQCSRWFFAKFAHQRFCSTRCRRKHHQSSEEFKAARREYMRQYYRLKTSGKVK